MANKEPQLETMIDLQQETEIPKSNEPEQLPSTVQEEELFVVGMGRSSHVD